MIRRRSAPAVWLLVAAAAVAVAGCGASTGEYSSGGNEPPAEIEGGRHHDSDAPVLIEAYYPLNESHQFIADYLLEIGDLNPGKVEVIVVDWQTEEGREKLKQTDLQCSGVYLNGSTTHELETPDGIKTVKFLKRLDVFWTREDFEAVARRELAKVGEDFQAPEPPEKATPDEEKPEAESSDETAA
jgi:hypothetical protein